MTEYELGTILKEMYETGLPKKEATTYIHLFGIKYANEIQNNRLSIPEIVRASGISVAYATEVHKGVRLGKYVEVL